MKNNKTLEQLIKQFFTSNPSRDIAQQEVTTWLKTEYKKYNGKEPQDPWRSVRLLHQKGFLIKVAKGIYRYEANLVKKRYHKILQLRRNSKF